MRTSAFHRVAINLAILVGVTASYAVVATEMGGQEYCLGGNLAGRAPSSTTQLFCHTPRSHSLPMPDLHWSALLPG